MERVEIERIIAPVVEIYSRGELRGAAYFNDQVGDHFVALGYFDLAESELGIALYQMIRARGFSVTRLCTALVMLDKSEQQRN